MKTRATMYCLTAMAVKLDGPSVRELRRVLKAQIKIGCFALSLLLSTFLCTFPNCGNLSLNLYI